MDENMKRKLVGGGKVVAGATQVVSGCLTAFGHGLVGSYCRKHHMMSAAARIAKQSWESGSQRFKDGLADLK